MRESAAEEEREKNRRVRPQGRVPEFHERERRSDRSWIRKERTRSGRYSRGPIQGGRRQGEVPAGIMAGQNREMIAF